MNNIELYKHIIEEYCFLRECILVYCWLINYLF